MVSVFIEARATQGPGRLYCRDTRLSPSASAVAPASVPVFFLDPLNQDGEFLVPDVSSCTNKVTSCGRRKTGTEAGALGRF
jgi:hypothetical protein